MSKTDKQKHSESFSFKECGEFQIMPNYRGGFDLDVDTLDSHYGESSETLDALEVYKSLKEYFKGTDYE